MNPRLKNVLNHIKFAFYPHGIRCILCGIDLDRDTPYGLCNDCSLPLNNKKFCHTCGAVMNNESDFCQRCKYRKWEFEAARSALVYEDSTVQLVRGYKFGSKKYLHRYMSHYMLDTLAQTDWEIDYIVSVPLSEQHQKTRNYNQAQLLANDLSKMLDIPLIDALKKIRNTQDQATLAFSERAQNISGCFDTTEQAQLLKNKTVLLIDDVFTTGATANECAHILKRFAAKIYVLTFASARQKLPLS